jgi:DNA segregation ATPase FtsK/SpoIIIE, S-DNA-T family
MRGECGFHSAGESLARVWPAAASLADIPRDMAKSARRAKTTDQHRRSPLARLLLAFALTAASVFVLTSLITFSPGDPPTHTVYPANATVENLCGLVGAWLSYHMIRLLGMGAWVLTLGLVAYALLVLGGRRIGYPLVRLAGVAMLALGAAGFQAMLLPSTGPFADLAGGVIGQGGAEQLIVRFGPVGTGVWLLLLMIVGGIVAMDRWLWAAPAWLLGIGGPFARRAGTVVGAAAVGAGRMGGELVAGLGQGRERAGPRLTDLEEEDVPGSKPRRRIKLVPAVVDEEESVDSAEEAEDIVEVKPRRRRKQAEEEEQARVIDRSETEDEEDEESAVVAEESSDEDEEEDDIPSAPQVYDPEALREKISKLPIVFGHQTRKVATEADLRDLQNVQELEGYRFPGLDLLQEPEANFSLKLEEYVREQAMALESALKQYRIAGEVTDIESGPVITLFHVKLAPGTKVAALSAVSSDIARALKAVNIRIVSNMAGRDTVGIEVPNTQKEKVRLKELMGKSELFTKMKLPMFLGKDASGEPLIADLTQMPHMLIAGTTGSGKSVCMNTIIMSFLYTKKPNELKLVLVDPKMVEMSQFKDIPHLMCPVVTEMAKAAAILEWATQKMDERYELLAEAGCRDISAYNELTWEELRERFNPQTPEEEAKIPRKLPYMVFIIDELADLMMTNKEVELAIIRIAQKARAVGIHLILATQRPQANVVTGLIKSNMPCRISFKVASGMDSRIVLDQKGGELLLGQGDMLYLSPRTSKLTRAQGTLVDDHEIRKVVRFMRDVASPSFERQLMAIRSGADPDDGELQSENNNSASLAAARKDPDFLKAVEIVIESRRGSVSLLQRRLAIGYTKASRFIDLMGIAGILGPHKGQGIEREVLVTLEEWEAMKRQMEADSKAAQGKLFDEGKDAAEAAAVLAAAEPARIEEDDAFQDAFHENDPDAPDPDDFDEDEDEQRAPF